MVKDIFVFIISTQQYVIFYDLACYCILLSLCSSRIYVMNLRPNHGITFEGLYVFYVCQACIYLKKKKYLSVILWKLITI